MGALRGAGKGLLDHLRIGRAHIMGACMGCCPVTAFAVAHPLDMVASMVLYWPVGGAKVPHQQSPASFAQPTDYVEQH